MKRIIYLFATLTLLFTSCEKNDVSDIDNYIATTQSEEVNRSIRPLVLGSKLNNPFAVENMKAALDTLKAHPDELDGCMKSPSSINDIVITATDLYVRFLPQDSAQYKLLMNDSTLTLFDFPLDYEIKQNGDYYLDPTVTGNYTWLYTRVPVGYEPPTGITYEILADLFIMENSPYYSEETMSEAGIMKAKSEYKTNLNDALKTIKALAFFNTGNKYGEKPATAPNVADGLMKVARSVKKTFLWSTWYETAYYPSGTIKVQDYHRMNSTAGVTNYSSITPVPLKGAKIHLWSWFKWNTVYTDSTGYYESDLSYDGNPEHYIYFTGKNGNNSWDLDRVMIWGVCLWVQKYSLGVQSKDEFNATIDVTSDAWTACVTNNAIYEYMTISDKEGLSRPPAHLQVALRENPSGLGSSSAPLFQNHTNTYTACFLGGFFNYVYSYTTEGSSLDPTSLPMTMFLNSLPDILLAGGNMNHLMNTYYFSRKEALYTYYSTIWHELTHASNLQRTKNEKGYGISSAFWTSLVGTEGGNSIASLGSSSYGKKGDSNWQQVALCEGWANYREWSQMKDFLKFDAILMSSYYGTSRPKDYNGSTYNTKKFPVYYTRIFDELFLLGCSYSNIEKSMTSKTFSGFKDNLISIYPTKSDSITAKINRYEAYNF